MRVVYGEAKRICAVVLQALRLPRGSPVQRPVLIGDMTRRRPVYLLRLLRRDFAWLRRWSNLPSNLDEAMIGKSFIAPREPPGAVLYSPTNGPGRRRLSAVAVLAQASQ